MRSKTRSNRLLVMSSEIKMSLIFSEQISRDGKPGLADFVHFVAASASLGMTDE